MSGDNPTGGDYQQGRPRDLTPDYISGFVDGEGCFSVSIRPHPTVRYGNGRRWLVGPVFQVYQHRYNEQILLRIEEFFGCGSIAPKGPKSDVLTYSVYSRTDLVSKIIPFFECHPLISEKRHDFEKFRDVVSLMERKLHRTDEGFRTIAKLAFSMNQRGKQRRYTLEEVLAEPSETVRRALV